MMPVYIWIILFVVLTVIEGLTAQLTTIWFAAGALVTIIATYLGAPEWLQWVIFLAVSLLLLAFTRKIALKLLKAVPKPTNADRIIGTVGMVSEDIDNIASRGLVKVCGSEWSARSEGGEQIPKGSEVEILRIEGVKVIVKLHKSIENKEETE